jgi:hypothetical protein
MEAAPEKVIVEEMGRSPKAALLLLTGEIERALRMLLAALGMTKRPMSMRKAVDTLERDGLVPKELREAVNQFSAVRDRIVHGMDATDSEAIRAIDAGLVILRTLRATPLPIATVKHVGLPLFADPAGALPLPPEVTGVVIQEVSADGSTEQTRILPTREPSLRVGSRVGWAYSYEREYGATWYRDPETQTIRQAWAYSKEFTGRPLTEM